jgi:hypothetical protein
MSFNSRLATAAAALVCSIALAAPAAQATTVSDTAGDFLTSFAGPHNGDLDVLSAGVTYNNSDIRLSGRMNGDIGTTANSIYVWGVDRGQGTPFLFRPATEANPIGEHVLFDAAIIMSFDPSLASFILYLDAAGHPTGTHALDAGAITFSGDTINALIPRDLLPSTGFDISQYGYNLWPRLGGVSNGTQVADFAPNDSTFHGTAVPEPASWAMMIMGFGVIGSAMRRRRSVVAA